ncbi:MAG: glycosyltransferase family A protein [Planctomycetota bacterium]|nr:glycosyltransferase family A protein [Planctomycetota bacterium]
MKKIACLCPTYGRPQLVRNSLACFLQQHYPEEQRRLFILDDGDQIASQSGTCWQVFSTPNRYPSMSAKYAELLRLADAWGADAYAVWDDDDLYFPWHLSAAAWAMSDGHKWSYPQWVMSDGGGQLQPEKTGGNLHGSIVISKDLMREVGGWPDTHRADFDLQMIGNLLKTAEPGRPDYEFAPSYMFRWASTGSRHYQNYVRSPEDVTTYARVQKMSDERVSLLQPEMDDHAKLVWSNVLPHIQGLRCVMPFRKHGVAARQDVREIV